MVRATAGGVQHFDLAADLTTGTTAKGIVVTCQEGDQATINTETKEYHARRDFTIPVDNVVVASNTAGVFWVREGGVSAVITKAEVLTTEEDLGDNSEMDIEFGPIVGPDGLNNPFTGANYVFGSNQAVMLDGEKLENLRISDTDPSKFKITLVNNTDTVIAAGKTYTISIVNTDLL